MQSCGVLVVVVVDGTEEAGMDAAGMGEDGMAEVVRVGRAADLAVDFEAALISLVMRGIPGSRRHHYRRKGS